MEQSRKVKEFIERNKGRLSWSNDQLYLIGKHKVGRIWKDTLGDSRYVAVYYDINNQQPWVRVRSDNGSECRFDTFEAAMSAVENEVRRWFIVREGECK